MWLGVDPRYLVIRLLCVTRSSLKCHGGRTDCTYVVAYLVPPPNAEAQRAAAEAAEAELMAQQAAAVKLAMAFRANMASPHAGSGSSDVKGVWRKMRYNMHSIRCISVGMQRNWSSWMRRLVMSGYDALKQQCAHFLAAAQRWVGALCATLVGARRAALLHSSSLRSMRGYVAALSTEFVVGPEGPPGQYGGVYSHVRYKSPVWNEHLELRLGGGVLNASTGEYENHDAPFTVLRVEVCCCE